MNPEQCNIDSKQTVFVVDDDPAVRDSLSLILGLHGMSVQTFSSAEAFLGAYDKTRTGCVLLDVRMPAMSGVELQAALRESHSNLPIIVMTAHGDIGLVRTVLKGGALDFLEKPVDPDVLLATVQAALDMDAATWAASRHAELAEQRLSRLTPRERQVLELVAKGYHYREIAEALSISPRTVEVHKSRGMEKLHARSVSTLVRIMLAAEPVTKAQMTRAHLSYAPD